MTIIRKISTQKSKRPTHVFTKRRSLINADNYNSSDFITILPYDVALEILFLLSPKDLVQCGMLSKKWKYRAGDSANFLWEKLFLLEYKENGNRFDAPHSLPWRRYFFQHQITRSIELSFYLSNSGDCTSKFVAINKQVYNVTDFIYTHPGGHRMILDVVGTDATQLWEEFQHSEDAQVLMKSLLVEDEVLLGIARRKNNGNLQIVKDQWQKNIKSHRHEMKKRNMQPSDMIQRLKNIINLMR